MKLFSKLLYCDVYRDCLAAHYYIFCSQVQADWKLAETFLKAYIYQYKYVFLSEQFHLEILYLTLYYSYSW